MADGAFENLGIVLMAQRRYQEALGHFTRAFEFARTSLRETDAELGYTYRHLAMAHHGLRNLDQARQLYGRSEATLLLAHQKIGSEDLKKRYAAALEQVLRYHLRAAEDAGDAVEVEKLKERLDAKR